MSGEASWLSRSNLTGYSSPLHDTGRPCLRLPPLTGSSRLRSLPWIVQSLLPSSDRLLARPRSTLLILNSYIHHTRCVADLRLFIRWPFGLVDGKGRAGLLPLRAIDVPRRALPSFVRFCCQLLHHGPSRDLVLLFLNARRFVACMPKPLDPLRCAHVSRMS
jgi:hypothetical protein